MNDRPLSNLAIESSEEEKKSHLSQIKPKGSIELQKIFANHHDGDRFFYRSAEDVMNAQASLVGNLILSGVENDVEEALALVKKYPHLVHCYATATDALGRTIKKRTLLQIAAMAGDVDLKEGITSEKDRGVVERLILAVGLPRDEVAKQLSEVITSKEAKEINAERNQRVLTKVKQIGEALIKRDEQYKDNKFKELQIFCQPLIEQLDAVLKLNREEVITAGYVFDSDILYQAAKWYQDNRYRFSSWWSMATDVFWINVFSKLQSNLSARDAQIVDGGIGICYSTDLIPPRRLRARENGVSCFYNDDSRLGIDICLGLSGEVLGPRRVYWVGGIDPYLQLSLAKKASLQSACNAEPNAVKRQCLIQ